MSETEEHRLLDGFCRRFDFLGSVEAALWPGIREPRPSITWDLEPVFAEFEQRFSVSDVCVAALIMDAFRSFLRSDEPVAALDIHHPGYWVDPWRVAEPQTGDAWPIGCLPNGDYWMFVAPDLRSGTFGHPWERTLCIFGEQLLGRVAEPLTEVLGEPYRVDGRACRSQRGLRWPMPLSGSRDQPEFRPGSGE